MAGLIFTDSNSLDQFASTYQFKGDWQQALQQWGIDTVLVPADSALATGLRELSRLVGRL